MHHVSFSSLLAADSPRSVHCRDAAQNAPVYNCLDSIICVPYHYFCDNYVDCDTEEDELNCGKFRKQMCGKKRPRGIRKSLDTLCALTHYVDSVHTSTVFYAVLKNMIFLE